MRAQWQWPQPQWPQPQWPQPQWPQPQWPQPQWALVSSIVSALSDLPDKSSTALRISFIAMSRSFGAPFVILVFVMVEPPVLSPPVLNGSQALFVNATLADEQRNLVCELLSSRRTSAAVARDAPARAATQVFDSSSIGLM
ncbi:hypothetical protein BE15_25050 [Sorangium cellulosum]|uniref:Uncharacterized protein n=1 Tax=Sorangium cellulosum TaxID=56 RepID=A0A150QRR9_SORCE|nr:hypothetical protein BE15_25050 [Sorangium cellulosum]